MKIDKQKLTSLFTSPTEVKSFAAAATRPHQVRPTAARTPEVAVPLDHTMVLEGGYQKAIATALTIRTNDDAYRVMHAVVPLRGGGAQDTAVEEFWGFDAFGEEAQAPVVDERPEGVWVYSYKYQRGETVPVSEELKHLSWWGPNNTRIPSRRYPRVDDRDVRRVYEARTARLKQEFSGKVPKDLLPDPSKAASPDAWRLLRFILEAPANPEDEGSLPRFKVEIYRLGRKLTKEKVGGKMIPTVDLSGMELEHELHSLPPFEMDPEIGWHAQWSVDLGAYLTLPGPVPIMETIAPLYKMWRETETVGDWNALTVFREVQIALAAEAEAEVEEVEAEAEVEEVEAEFAEATPVGEIVEGAVDAEVEAEAEVPEITVEAAVEVLEKFKDEEAAEEVAALAAVPEETEEFATSTPVGEVVAESEEPPPADDRLEKLEAALVAMEAAGLPTDAIQTQIDEILGAEEEPVAVAVETEAAVPEEGEDWQAERDAEDGWG